MSFVSCLVADRFSHLMSRSSVISPASNKANLANAIALTPTRGGEVARTRVQAAIDRPVEIAGNASSPIAPRLVS